MKKKVLKLTLTKVWFDLMLAGIKIDEYRAPTDWIKNRLIDSKTSEKKEYTHVKFTNGYGDKMPFFIAEYKGFSISESNTLISFNGEAQLFYYAGDYIIHLGEITETGNLK